VQFVEAAGGAQAWVQRTSAVSTSYTRWMEQALRDFSGVDWTRPDSAPSLEHTPMGDLLVQYVATRHGLDGLLERAAASDLAVSRWIEQQFQAFSGVDWRSPQSKPNLELLFRWPAR
jgi:hypothetical protein